MNRAKAKPVDMPRWEISARQAGWLAAGIVSATGHAFVATYFLRVGGRDAWMCALLAMPAAAVGLSSIYKLSRLFPGQTIVEYLPRIFGYFGYPLALLYPLYYLTVVVFTLRVTADWLVDSILPETPSGVMSVLYMAVVLYAAWGGLDVLARINTFVLIVLSVQGGLVALGTIGSKDYHLLLPIFEFGFAPALAAAWLALGYLGELAVAASYGAYVRTPDRPKLRGALLYAVLFEGVTTTGPLAGSISTMGYGLSQSMPYPTFRHWLMFTFARFFERIDLLAVHQWLAGAFPRTGVFLLMGADGLTRLTGTQRYMRSVLIGLGALTVLLAEVVFPTKHFFAQFVQHVYLPAGAVLGVILPPFYLLVALVRGMQRQNRSWSPGA